MYEGELMSLISDAALAALECPTVEEQARLWKKTTAFINNDGLERMLASLDGPKLSLINYRAFDESGGIVNQIYLIQVHDALEDANKELVLKVINPEERFHNHKACEGALIKYLRANTTIPVPTVLSYSNDTKTSPIKCKYVLLEKAPGCPLKDVLPRINNQVPERLIRELVQYIRQLRLLRPFDRDLVGCFGVSASLPHEPELWPPHPRKKLHSSYFDAWNESIIACISEMNKLKTHQATACLLDAKRATLFDRVAQIKAHSSLAPTLKDLVHDKKLYLTHGDLNETNIIVDPETLKINCIIDWEWSEYSISDDLNLYHYWFAEDPEQRRRFKGVMERILGEKEFTGSRTNQKTKKMHKFKQYLFRVFISATCSSNINCFFLKNLRTTEEKSLAVRKELLNHLGDLERRLENFDSFMNEAFDLSP